jgi:hypothetical protein
VVDFAEAVAGNEVSDAFTGNILFNDVSASAAGLPESAGAKLKATVPVTVPVTITNNGAAPEAFFVDPRLTTATDYTLPTQLSPSGTVSLPMTGNPPVWLVPTQTYAVSVAQTASLPSMFDFSPFSGDPDISSHGPGSGPLCSANETAGYAPSGGSVTAGLWSANPTECGPYSQQAPAGTATASMSVETKAFDPAVTSPGGDIWLDSVDPTAPFSPITINPGQSATINVTITPTGPVGTVITGDLYVDDFVNGVSPYGQLTGDELAAIPYEYTIGR